MRTSAISGQHHSTSITPPLFQPKADSAVLCAGSFAPFHYTTSDAVNGNQTLPLTVPHLFCSGSPSNIALFIMTIVVNSIKLMRGRGFLTHFGKKLFKGIKAELNFTSAIMRVTIHCGVSAAIFRSVVSIILSRTLSDAALSVCYKEFRSRFSSPTSTRFGSERSQFTRRRTSDSSTFAFAEPMVIGASFARVAQYGQSSKDASSPILKQWTAWMGLKNNILFGINHSPIVTHRGGCVYG